jgi:hypothetical protein
MPEVCGNIKTVLSNPAKILLAYMRCSGISDAKQLATDLDIPIRTIQRLKLECATSANDAISGADETAKDANCAISGVEDAPNAPDMALAQDLQSCAGATNELPTEVLSSSIVTPLAPHSSKTTSRRGSRLTPEWDLPDEWRTWARTNFPASNDDQVADQAAQFRDYWIAKPGAQACKLDWEATWRNWCRKGLSAYGSVRKPQSTGSFKPNGFTPYVVPYVAPKQSKGISQADLEAMVLADEASYAG